MRRIKPPKLLYINIFTLITVVVWIVTSVLRVLLAKPEHDVPKEILVPISPTLDVSVLSEIEQRLYFEDSEIPEELFFPVISENE
jgi:hypothetical protein